MQKSIAIPSRELATLQHPVAKAVNTALCSGATLILLSTSPVALSDSTFGAVFELSELDGSNGFVINGINADDQSGRSVSGAGDVNGDGVEDLIIGAFQADPNGNSNAGKSFVVFGGIGIGSSGPIELSNVDGSNGFSINGIDAGDRTGRSVSSAGDINGDGIADLLIGAYTANPNNLSSAGESYVVFGGGNVGGMGTIELSGLSVGDGFVINGAADSDQSGRSVSSAGDVNGDGVDDLIIGARLADVNSYLVNTGKSYIVFGDVALNNISSLNLADLDGSEGIVLNGIDRQDYSGTSVSSAGDVNGDGTTDILIGAIGARQIAGQITNLRAGESYVVFGNSSLGNVSTVELSDLDGSDGLVIKGIDAEDRTGGAVSGVGDVNGDGIEDYIVGAYDADPNGTPNAGESYVVFGGTSLTSPVELSALDGTDGFVVNGIDSSDRSGRALGGGGDINNDGFADLIIGAAGGGLNSNVAAGETFVVFGSDGIGDTGTIELSALDGSDGFVIRGIDQFDRSAQSVAIAGDINGDGLVDLVVGAPEADPNSNLNAGETYVIFGKVVPQCNGKTVTVDLNFGQSPGPSDDVILGTAGNDDIRGRSGNDTICGESGNDFIHGNSGDDWIDGGDGSDELRGGQGNDVIYTGAGSTVGTASIVFGGNGNDEIFGGVDADAIFGGRGLDTLYGGDGDDEITGNSDNDVIEGGNGDDNVRGGQGDDELFGNAGIDFLSGGGGLADICDGGDDIDSAASSCETVIDIP